MPLLQRPERPRGDAFFDDMSLPSPEMMNKQIEVTVTMILVKNTDFVFRQVL